MLQTRHEMISTRLRTLQELVPNGSKVDIKTWSPCSRKVISYVKVLQLKVKVRISLT
jgi:hypothetical protein